MRVRAIDDDGDWFFGKGQNDYKTQKSGVAQEIRTRLSSFYGDCFFDTEAGIDWFNLLGGRDKLAIQISVSAASNAGAAFLCINTLNSGMDLLFKAFLF